MHIRPQLLAPVKSYADHTPEATPDTLDCSLGVNPYGFPPAVKPALAAFDWERLSSYPHDHTAEQAILRHWGGQLGPQNLILSDGSISALYLINNLFAKPGARVVGFFPTFTDMVVNTQMLGMDYVGVPFSPAEDYRANMDALLAQITPDTALVYIDNPNNPTGQVLPLADIRRAAEKARAVGAYLVADEAYGDFISREESALALWGEFDNLIVVRTFSKGFGLAGLRAGYILLPEELRGYVSKISNPYMMNELSRVAVAAALEQGDYPASHGADFGRMKAELQATLGEKLFLATTDPRVPICTLGHRDPTADLQQLLYRHGVLSVSGQEFDSLGGNFVRLRVPRAEDMGQLLWAVEAVEQGR